MTFAIALWIKVGFKFLGSIAIVCLALLIGFVASFGCGDVETGRAPMWPLFLALISAAAGIVALWVFV